MRILVSLFLLLTSSVLFGQQRFYKLYSGTGYDQGEDVLQLADSSFVACGSSGSWDNNSQGFLLKLDKQGNYTWSQQYGGPESEEIKRVALRPGMGYYLMGCSASWNQGNLDPMLIYTDLAGNQQWIKTISSESWERIYDGVMTKDTGLVVVGERQALGGGSADVLMIRYDKNGDTIWTKTFGTAGDDRAYSILRTQDSLFVVGGEWYVSDSSATKGFVLKMNDAGSILWQDTVGHLSGQFQVFDLTETPFGYMFAGTHTVTNTNHNDFTGMVSLSGVITNQFSLGDTPLFSDNRVQQIAYVPQQGACAFGIQVHNTGTFSESYDLNMGYADALYGYWLGWPSTLILNQGYDYCGNIRPTSDGGYVAVGMNSTLNDGQNQLNGGANVFVLKIDAAGGGFIKTDTVFTVHQLVGLEPITAQAHSIQVYPNPMSNEIHVHFDAQEAVQIGLYNAQGQLISSGLFFNEALFETTQLEAGTYILKVGTQGYPLLKY